MVEQLVDARLFDAPAGVHHHHAVGDFGDDAEVMSDEDQRRPQPPLQIFDLGDMLKDVPETIYADDIHFIRDAKGDSKGYRMMAARVADELGKVWNLKAK